MTHLALLALGFLILSCMFAYLESRTFNHVREIELRTLAAACLIVGGASTLGVLIWVVCVNP